MKTTKTLLTALAVSASVVTSMTIVSSPSIAAAMDDTIVVDNVRARPSLGAAKNSATFFNIHNKGGKANKLIKAQGNVSKRVELHNHIKDNGVFRMRQVHEIAVPADGMAQLKPGGYHVMLIGLTRKLKIGDTFKLKLTFANGEVKTLDVPVKKIGGHGTMKMDHKKMMMDHKKKMPAN